MAYEEDAARIGVTGALRVGPIGSTFPEAMGAWATPFVDLGYISADGITESRDEDVEAFTPWQRKSPIRREKTREEVTFKTVLWESNFHTLSLYYGVGLDRWTTVPATGGKPAVHSFAEGDDNPRDVRAFGIDMVDGVYARRAMIPYGEVTERGDIVYQRASIIAYEVTITAYVGPDGVSVVREFQEGWDVPELPAGGN
ncbi:major tail protein [Gordonia phage Banquo]|nr:major tail protein [Gordonia phage Banquo]